MKLSLVWQIKQKLIDSFAQEGIIGETENWEVKEKARLVSVSRAMFEIECKPIIAKTKKYDIKINHFEIRRQMIICMCVKTRSLVLFAMEKTSSKEYNIKRL